jgi:hypothetical protein
VVVATFPAAFTVRQFDPDVLRPAMVKFVVVALPLRISPPNVGTLVVPMSCGKPKLMMFDELVAAVIWFAAPWIWNVDVVRLLIVIAPEPVPVIVIIFGDEVETVTVPAPTMEVVVLERPLMAVMPLVLETFAGVQKLPFQVRTWFVNGAVDETARPWMPITVWEVELPERSPSAVKLPTPHPVQAPLTTRFCSEVVVPVIVTVPGKVAVMPDLPIVMPVAEDAPTEIVPIASMTLFESPVMLVLLKVSAANAGPAVSARTPKMIPAMRGHAARLSSDDFISRKWLIYGDLCLL